MSEHLPEPLSADFVRLVNAVPVIRPVRQGDRALIDELMRGLAPSTRFRRFHAAMNELPTALLDRLADVGPAEAAFLAIVNEQGRERAVGEVRYAPSVEDAEAREFAVVVSDPWQRIGLGTTLLGTLVQHASRQDVAALYGDTFVDNVAMLALARRLGFDCLRHPEDATLVRTTVRLDRKETELELR